MRKTKLFGVLTVVLICLAVIFFSDVNAGSQFLPIRSLKDATAIILSRSPIVSKISLNDFSLLRNVLYMRLNLIRSR